jgi:hypothetical protein
MAIERRSLRPTSRPASARASGVGCTGGWAGMVKAEDVCVIFAVVHSRIHVGILNIDFCVFTKVISVFCASTEVFVLFFSSSIT